jgi:hypothetical protein
VQVRHLAQLTLTFTNKFTFDRDQRGAKGKFMNGVSTPQSAALGQIGTALNRPQQLNITKVSNGFVVGSPYGMNEQQVALDEASMLDLVKAYFEQQPNQPE